MTRLEEGILLLDLELVRAEQLNTMDGLFPGQNTVVALEQLEDVVEAPERKLFCAHRRDVANSVAIVLHTGWVCVKSMCNQIR